MAEDNFTLTTFYTSWKEYQDRIKGAIAPLTAEQLELRAAPHLRSIGENVLHIIGCRAGWFTDFLGEDCGADVKACASWDVPGAPVANSRSPSACTGSRRISQAKVCERLDSEEIWRFTNSSARVFMCLAFRKVFCSSTSKRHMFNPPGYTLHLGAYLMRSSW